MFCEEKKESYNEEINEIIFIVVWNGFSMKRPIAYGFFIVRDEYTI